MDPFCILPPEIRIDILCEIRSERRSLQLARASPVMLNQYIVSKQSIVRAMLASDLDGLMVQDAAAIITFPTVETSEYPILVRRHFESWAAQQLPDPIKEYKPIQELHQLYRSLLLFIEDYLTKATAIFPPREYTCLFGKFRGEEVVERFDAADLSGPERKRLLKAFLRYELLCKIRHTQRKDQMPAAWDLAPLYRYGGQEFQAFEREAIRCVRTYVESLYGAMFAQCGNSWSPGVMSCDQSRCRRPDQYPYTCAFAADAYAPFLGMPINLQDISSSLGCLGLDLAAAFLRSSVAGQQGRNSLACWFRRWPDAAVCCRQRFVFDRHGFPFHPSADKDEHYKEGPGMYQMLCPHMSGTLGAHIQLLRQRAWVFFDDTGHYPASPSRCPAWEDHGGDKRTGWLDWFIKPVYGRALHQWQGWHDELKKAPYGQRNQDPEVESGVESPLPVPTELHLLGRVAPFWQ